MKFEDKLDPVHHHTYAPKQCQDLAGHPSIEGYDFEKGLNFSGFLESLKSTGFQATHLAQGMEIVKAMRREKAVIFLGFTSNMASCGVREQIKYLVKNKKVDVLVTSAGGIEEDIIKTLKPFVVGQFEAHPQLLFENGINRTGNIFIPNDRYTYFDKFMQGFLLKIYEQQKETGKVFCPKDLIRELGLAIDDDSSFLYWAAKNDIPVFCPGLVDGAIGDLIVFFKRSHPDFLLDVSKEVYDITRITLNAEKTGAILLGGGISKHFVLNANIFREGVDYAVYINTAQEYDGSDSGARVEEAITWGKVKVNAPHVKIHCDASIAFPLLVAGSFAQEDLNNN
ncbi:MAG: deoxyhypusine synthase [Candidatus Woesearchaeota archaeon]